MLKFRPEHFAALGEGVLIPDGDCLYITNRHWLLVVTACEVHIPMEILKLVAYAEHGSFVDWRILGAKEIFLAEKKFIPGRGGRSFDIYTDSYKYSRTTVEGIREMMETNADCLWGTCYRMDQLFAAGNARTKYLRPQTSDKRKFSVEPAAEHYLFTLDGKPLVTGAAYFRTFFDLGFEINCPVKTSGPPPVLGLYLKDTVPDIFGYLAVSRGTGIRETNTGRKLYVDADEASWYTVDEGVQELQDWKNYIPGVMSPATTQVEGTGSEELRLGVSILRWHNIMDEEINALYEEGRSTGLNDRLDVIKDRLKTLVDQAEGHNLTLYELHEHLERHRDYIELIEIELGNHDAEAHALLQTLEDYRKNKL